MVEYFIASIGGVVTIRYVVIIVLVTVLLLVQMTKMPFKSVATKLSILLFALTTVDIQRVKREQLTLLLLLSSCRHFLPASCFLVTNEWNVLNFPFRKKKSQYK